MSKTSAVQGYQSAIVADALQLRRLQTAGIDINMSVEDISELANKDFVSSESNIPEVTLSLEFNDIGSMEPLLAFTQQLDPDGANPFAATVTPTNIDAGRTLMLAPIKEGESTWTRTAVMKDMVVSSVSMTYDQGGVAKESYNMMCSNFRWYLGENAAVYQGAVYNPTIAERGAGQPYDGMPANAVQIVSPLDGTTPLKGYDVTNTTWHRKPLKNKAGDYFLLIDGVEFKIKETVPGTPDWQEETYNLVGVQGIVTLDDATVDFTTLEYSRISILYSPVDAAGAPRTETFPALNTGIAAGDTGNTGAVFAGGIVPYLYSTAAGNKEWTMRMQTCNINIDMGRQNLGELGNAEYYDYLSKFPINVTAKCDFNESDLEVMAKLIGKEAEFDAGSLNSIDISQFVKDIKLVVEIYSDKYIHDATTLVKTVTLTNMNVTNNGNSVTVGDLMKNSLDLKGSNISIVGTNVNPYPAAAAPIILVSADN